MTQVIRLNGEEGLGQASLPTIEFFGPQTDVGIRLLASNRNVRHGLWRVEVARNESCLVYAEGTYHYGKPQGMWVWRFADTRWQTIQVLYDVASCMFRGGNQDGWLNVFHTPSGTDNPGPDALLAYYRHGVRECAESFEDDRFDWHAFDAAGEEVWTGRFLRQSVQTTFRRAMTPEDDAGRIYWIRELHWKIPEHGAYVLIVNRLLKPVRVAD